MRFNKHLAYEGKHAFMGASQHSWLNYSDDKLVNTYNNLKAKERGTELHAFAAEAIRLGIKLQKTKTPSTIAMYVNDAIGFKMEPEVVLYYSDFCFGTADTICFRNDFLRIHDFKSGTVPAKMEQLIIYSAIFCLEYNIKPEEIKTELRIYQNSNCEICNPDPAEIRSVMNKIVQKDKVLLKSIKEAY